MIARGYIAGAAVLGLIASHGWTAWHFQGRGYDARTAEYDAARRETENDLLDAANENNRRALQFQEQDDARSARAMEAENAARDDADACRLPDPDSLRRLEWRWGSP